VLPVPNLQHLSSVPTALVKRSLNVQVSSLELVISFLSYPDIETLRNCCLYLHNFTKDLRLSWRLFGPLRAFAVMRVLSLFLDSAKLDNDGVVRPHFPLNDSEGKELCHRFLRQGTLGALCTV
jgi:hypothetical protein